MNVAGPDQSDLSRTEGGESPFPPWVKVGNEGLLPFGVEIKGFIVAESGRGRIELGPERLLQEWDTVKVLALNPPVTWQGQIGDRGACALLNHKPISIGSSKSRVVVFAGELANVEYLDSM